MECEKLVLCEEWDKVFAVNARAPFFICQAALEPLKKSSKPMVINIASVVGFKGYINQSVYSSSKHALTGFTKVFAKEVQPFGISMFTEIVIGLRDLVVAGKLIQGFQLHDPVEGRQVVPVML